MLKILNVDDRPENRYMLEIILGAAGYEVHSAEHGVEALTKLDQQSFDLIISDILMPQMDGFQFCREVKRRSEFQNIPFIFYSATYTEDKDKELALSLGAARFIVKPMEPEYFLDAVREVIQAGETGHAPSPAPPEDSEEVYLAAYNKRLIHKLEHKIDALEATARDLEASLRAKEKEMAERKQAENALRASEAKYRLITDHMGDVVWLWQLGSDYFAYVSPSVERLRQYTANEVMTRPVRESMSPEAWESLNEEFRKRIEAMESGDPSARYGVTEVDQPRKDGTVVPTEVVTRLMTNETGHVTGLLGVSRDITLRRRYMEALRASETKYRNLFTRAAEGIFQVDLQDRVVDTNPALAAMFGYSSPQEMINSAEKISEIVVHPEERKRLVDLLMQQNAVDRYEIEVFRKDGHRIWVSVSAHTVRNDQGEIQYFEGMCLDITKQKKAQEEILALNSHLEQRVQERTAQFEASNHELEAFASSVSHDLKSPLRSIKGFSQALMEDFGNILPPEGQDQLQRVLNESTRMENLIEDLLRLAHVGEQDLILDEVDISAMTSSLAKSLAEANPERKVSWEVEPGIVVHGDPVLMRVLMDNLLSNAWKFTSRSAEAKIRVVRLASEPGWTDFAVEDNGVGFEPANTNRLFTPFQRMHSSSEFPGTGIGLAIVRRIANRHGAHVSAHGKPGEGARILLSFPNRGNGPTETWS